MTQSSVPQRTESNQNVAQRQWFIVGRWQEFDGEWRANVVRTVAVAAFYGVELLGYYDVNLGWLQMEPAFSRQFHLAITALAAAWIIVAFGTFYCLQSQFFPAALKYFTTGCDVILLTTMLMAASGPRSPLVVGYFVVIAVSALRFQLRLVWCATLGSMAGYIFLLGFAKWHATWFNLPPREMSVPRYAQLLTLLAMALTGIALGQLIRQVKSMAEDYAARVQQLDN
jgi:hypothetical protein